MRFFGKERKEARNKELMMSLIQRFSSALSNCQWEEVIQLGEKLVKIFKRRNYKLQESQCCTNLGIAYNNLGYFSKAVECQEKSLRIAREIGNRVIESECYKNLCIAHQNLGNLPEACEYKIKAINLGIARGVKDPGSEGDLLKAAGEAIRTSRWREAVRYGEVVAKIARECGDVAGECVAYAMLLGVAYVGLGDFKQALYCYSKALELISPLPDGTPCSKLECMCYSGLGVVYRNLGDYKRAIDWQEKVIQISRDIGNRKKECSGYIELGQIYNNRGNFNKAIEYHTKGLDVAKEIGFKEAASKSCTGLGNSYLNLGAFVKAIEFHSKALEIDRDIGDQAGISKGYTGLAIAYAKLGEFDRSIEYFEKSLQIKRDIGDEAGEYTCYGILASICAESGRVKTGIEFTEKALKWFKGIDNRIMEATCLANLGCSYYVLGDLNKAIEHIEEADKINRDIGNISLARNTNANLARIYASLGKPEVAYSYCQRSIELSEMVSGTLVEEEHKIPFAGRISDAYQLMIPLCLRLKKDEEAFEYAERSKSRAFLDLLAATEIKPSVELTSELSSLLDNEENCLARLREIQTRHLRQTKVSVEPGEVERIREKLDEIYDQMKEYDPEYVFLRRGKPLSIKGIQEMLSSNKRNAILLEYFITKDETFIFVVSSKDRELHIQTVPVSAETLNRYVFESYWREVPHHKDFDNIGNSWLGLSNYLIEPISQYLTEGDLVYLVPYGPLHYIPMHALELNGEPLIRSHTVAYSPSASLLKFCQSKGSEKLESCASFGVAFGKNEEAKFEKEIENLDKEEKEEKEKKFKKTKALFEGEAKNIAEFFSTKGYTGDLTTKDTVRKNCIDKDVIHFSCHGYFDNAEPLSSGVELYDGVLSAREIFNMRLNTELVTLSACETGLNEIRPGDELIGLTRAFLYAGAPSVMVSLWSVDAGSTQELMLEFYKLLKNGSDKATALQEAQKKIMMQEGGKYSHPYYWAPFVLIGDWK